MPKNEFISTLVMAPSYYQAHTTFINTSQYNLTPYTGEFTGDRPCGFQQKISCI